MIEKNLQNVLLFKNKCVSLARLLVVDICIILALKDWNKQIYKQIKNYSYEDECFKFITTVKKYNSNDPSLDDDYEFNFTFYLKTLGGVGA